MPLDDGLDIPECLRRIQPNKEVLGPERPITSLSVEKPAAGLTTQPRVIYTYTNLNCYNSICPHQFYRRYVTKDLPFVETEAMKYGTQVHKAMEERIVGNKPLPLHMNNWEPLVAVFARRGAKAEMKLAITRDYQPADFWGKNIFMRGKADVVLINNSRLYLGDWKTGKRREDPFELEVQAMMIRAAYPNIEVAIGTYIWLKEGQVGTTHQLPPPAVTFDKCTRIAQSIENDTMFAKRPGPLCKWCDVVDCEHNANSRRP